MKNKYNIAIIVALIITLLLTGCSSSTQDDSTNKYKLPLGDSGYLSEMDFSLYKYNEIKDENETIKGIIDYNYVSNNQKYTIKLSAKAGESFDDKAVKMSVGYYENEKFVEVAEPKIVNVSNELLNQKFYSYEYEFTYGSDAENNKDSMVFKLSFGTSVDEEYYKSINTDYKKSDINKYKKQYRNAELKINELSIIDSESTEESILTEKATLNNVVVSETAKAKNDLYYYNTASVSYAEKTLTLTLNGKYNWWQWIVNELGKLLYWLTNLVGGYYWLGLTIFTLALRTAGWPIYAKSNSTTSNMSSIQPEMERINKKYEGKTDQNSKMKQQMEMRDLMKKNHVSMAGCLLPFAQMPIFFAVYQVVQRFPLTPIYDSVNYNFLWTTFKMTYGEAQGDWILAILVGLTMVWSQLLSMYMQKRAQKRRENFYTAKNKQNNNSLMIMMVVTTVMMVAFAWKSAGIAYYWIIGNTYQIAQTAISKLQEEKKADKEVLKSKKVRGR